MSYSAYPEYKDSCITWLGEVPAHWKKARLKYYITLNPNVNLSSVNAGDSITFLPMEYVKKGYFIPNTAERSKINASYNLFQENDIILAKVTPCFENGNIAIAKKLTNGIGFGSSELFVLRARKKDTAFIYWLLHSEPFKSSAIASMYGAGGLKRVPGTQITNYRFLKPPEEEQHAIVTFLNRETQKIDVLIAEQEKLLDLIIEKRQALISHAVTQGLSPNAPMKDSGINWIGQIPMHWELKKTKYCLRITNGSNPNTEGNIPVYGSGSESFKSCGEYKEGPAVLIGRKGATLHIPHYITGLYWNVDTAFDVKNKSFFALKYYYYLACCFDYNAYISQTTLPSMTQTNYSNMVLPFPPLSEQQDIVTYLDQVTATIDKIRIEAEHGVALLLERRSALISAAVTGKICVIEPAAKQGAEPQREANTYFKRAVFAAEIISRMHNQLTFGHVKFQKMLFLAENICQIDLGTHYHRDAAGPYDNRAIRSIDTQIAKQKWFQCEKMEKGYRYVPMEKEQKYREYFERYYSDEEERLSSLCKCFMTATTEQCEIVATLYSAWKDLLLAGNPSDERIVDEVLNNWHPSKRRIERERWLTALRWMRDKKLCPEAK